MMKNSESVKRQRKQGTCNPTRKRTVSDLAERTGLSVSFISRVLRGQRTPSAYSLIALANSMGISTDTLIEKLGLKKSRRECEKVWGVDRVQGRDT